MTDEPGTSGISLRAHQISLLVLTHLKLEEFHPNFQKDILCAIEATRAAISKAVGR